MARSIGDNVHPLLERFAADFAARFAGWLPEPRDASDTLVAAMRYAALGPGKRIRPFLVHQCCTLVGGSVADADAPAAAVELVHAFSLVHDDLPAMDDDVLRRGRPTCHVQFDEATAILAGDALLALAFEILATAVPDAHRGRALIAELARATGSAGMIGGQAADLAGERAPCTLERVRDIHARKTGALITAACRMGGIAGGAARDKLERLADYGRNLGLAFQIADDLLDVTATTEQLGKATAKDAARRKQTYPACVGTEQASIAGEAAVADARAALRDLGPEADVLRALADFVLVRRS